MSGDGFSGFAGFRSLNCELHQLGDLVQHHLGVNEDHCREDVAEVENEAHTVEEVFMIQPM